MRNQDLVPFLVALGKPGKFAWIIFCLMCLNYFPVAFNHLVMSVYGAVPPHHCRLPGSQSADNTTIPETNGKLDSCHVYANYSHLTNQEVPCPDGWEYTLIDGESTLVNEWDLVCDDKYLTSLATTVYFAGVMVGGLICGPLADTVGRLPVMVLTIYTPILLGIMVYLLENLALFMLVRFILGVMMQGIQIVSFVVAMELNATSKYRAYHTALFETSWATGVMVLSGIAYFLRDWRHVQLGITLPSLLSVAYIWFVPESLRWLINKGRFTRARDYMQNAAKVNHVTLSDVTLDQLKDVCLQVEKHEASNERKPRLWDVFRTPNLRKHTFVMFYVWLATSLGYYGLSLQASRFTGDKYLNFFINGAIELPAYLLGIVILSRIGRRLPLCVYFLIGGVACILAGVIPKQTSGGDDIAWLSTALAWIGKFSTAGCWSVLFLYSSELYPTPIRNAAVGACAFWARVGSLLSPQIILLADYTYSWLPLVIFGVFAVVGGLVTLLLPETKDREFPDTFEEAEDLGNKHRKSRDSQVNGMTKHDDLSGFYNKTTDWTNEVIDVSTKM